SVWIHVNAGQVVLIVGGVVCLEAVDALPGISSPTSRMEKHSRWVTQEIRRHQDDGGNRAGYGVGSSFTFRNALRVSSKIVFNSVSSRSSLPFTLGEISKFCSSSNKDTKPI